MEFCREYNDRAAAIQEIRENLAQVEKTASLAREMEELLESGQIDKCIDAFIDSAVYIEPANSPKLVREIRQRCLSILERAEAQIFGLLEQTLTLPTGIHLLNLVKRMREIKKEKSAELRLAKEFIHCRNKYLVSSVPPQLDGYRHFLFDLVTLFRLMFPEHISFLSSYMLHLYKSIERFDNDGLKIYFAGSMARLGFDFRRLLLREELVTSPNK